MSLVTAVRVLTVRETTRHGAYAVRLDPLGALHALEIRCPQCGGIDLLPMRPLGKRAYWTVSGDPMHPETLSLSPSVHHAADRGGCGWHGYLRMGEWVGA